MTFIHNFFILIEPITLLKTLGIAGLFFAIFAESGLFFGFFFPGDSLLFTAGFLASQNILNIQVILWGAFLCAILGDSIGYWFGRKVGIKIFNKDDSFFFNRRHIERTEVFYNRYGNKTIFLARFVPIVRTFAPILAGVGNMKYKDFIIYNMVGGFVWSFVVILAGFFLGRTIPNLDGYLLPIILLIIFISFLPVIFEIVQSRKKAS